ncbi:UNVERIFIED_CONTAM: unc-89 [Trichonephila clavipes]
MKRNYKICVKQKHHTTSRSVRWHPFCPILVSNFAFPVGGKNVHWSNALGWRKDKMLECKVAGTPKPKVTWYKSGKVLRHNPQYQIFYEPTGKCTLTITRCTEEDNTEFSCEAQNRNGVDFTTSKVTVTGWQFKYKPRKPDWAVEMETKQKIEVFDSIWER